jgi:mRNA interferase RelE/StbE
MSYVIKIKPTAQKAIKKLPLSLQQRIIEKLKALEHHPRQGAKKLQSFENRYRIRVGDFRIIYEIYDNRLLVIVLEVGHRSHIYRRKK